MQWTKASTAFRRAERSRKDRVQKLLPLLHSSARIGAEQQKFHQVIDKVRVFVYVEALERVIIRVW